ncbi:AAA family ATPase [Promicromonospora sukumoe]|uniref:AAA family ATPase n=1 Tax=Promicromonospora sukumoe TaxID=88382 RepID=UPI0037CC48CF
MDPLVVPVPSLVLLIGPSGSGKSTWVARHFGPYEVVSSDRCRAMIADSEADQSVTPAAFELVRFIAARRLEAGRLAVVDATNVHAAARRHNLDLAAACGVPAVAIVLDLPVERMLANNAGRAGRVVDDEVVRRQRRDLDEALGVLGSEGYAAVHVLDEATIDAVTIERVQEP